MKKYKILFWITTSIIVLMEGALPLFTGHSEMSVQGITGLGYPFYFVTLLVAFKVVGSIVLVFPNIPNRFKEWAYAGFGIDFIAALVSIIAVSGISIMILMPLVFFGLLAVSYISWNKLNHSSNQ